MTAATMAAAAGWMAETTATAKVATMVVGVSQALTQKQPYVKTRTRVMRVTMLLVVVGKTTMTMMLMMMVMMTMMTVMMMMTVKMMLMMMAMMVVMMMLTMMMMVVMMGRMRTVMMERTRVVEMTQRAQVKAMLMLLLMPRSQLQVHQYPCWTVEAMPTVMKPALTTAMTMTMTMMAMVMMVMVMAMMMVMMMVMKVVRRVAMRTEMRTETQCRKTRATALTTKAAPWPLTSCHQVKTKTTCLCESAPWYVTGHKACCVLHAACRRSVATVHPMLPDV